MKCHALQNGDMITCYLVKIIARPQLVVIIENEAMVKRLASKQEGTPRNTCSGVSFWVPVSHLTPVTTEP
jgi:hypothetical protein